MRLSQQPVREPCVQKQALEHSLAPVLTRTFIPAVRCPAGVIALALLFSAVTVAAPKKVKAPAVPAPPADVAQSASKPVAMPPGLSGEQALAQLRSLYGALEYAAVIPYAAQVLAREDLTLSQRIEAYEFQGKAKAIVQDPVDAEAPFRMLLRAQPEYDMPASTPPKILAVFRKVQSEERALAAQLREVERSRLIANLRISPGPTPDATGGLPIIFAYRVRDTAGVVETVRVQYRRSGQKAFSSLALERNADGEWRGLIPGEFTADANGFSLEYVTETADRQGPLLAVGSEAKPQIITVAAGQVPVKSFKPIPRGVFITSVGATAAVGIAAGVMAFLFNREQSSFNSAVAMSQAPGRELVAQIQRGESYATATNALLIAAGASLALSLIFLPLTRFSDE